MTEAALEEENEQADEQESSDDRPAIEDDERAEFELGDLADEIEDETAPESDEQEAVEEQSEAVESGASGDSAEEPTGGSWGEKYVAILSLVLAGVVAHDSDEEIDVETKATDISDLATFGPLDLATDVDRLLEQQGHSTDLPPGKAVAFGTLAIAAVVVATETDLLSTGIESLTEDL